MQDEQDVDSIAKYVEFFRGPLPPFGMVALIKFFNLESMPVGGMQGRV